MIAAATARLLTAAVCCAGIVTYWAAPSAGAAVRPAALPAAAAALYAPQTGQLLYGVNPHRRLAIASTTKLMTALVTLEHVRRLSIVFAQNDFYPETADSQIGLVPGERMSVHDLLLAMMLPSADDAAEDLAFNVGHGSVPAFVAMMNAQARRLGLHDTHYTTPSGLDTPGNYSSAADLARLAEYDLRHSRFLAHIVDLPSAQVRRGAQVVSITNLNDLVSRFRWIDGVKTGHTARAGYVLVAAGHRDGMPLVSVVLGTPSAAQRDASSLALLRYGFAAFAPRALVRSGTLLARTPVQDQPDTHASLVAAGTLTRTLPRGMPVHLDVHAPHQLAGPLPSGAAVGGVTVTAGGRILGRVPLVLAHRLTAVSGLTLAARFVTRPLTLLIVVAAVALVLVLLRGARRRRRDRPGAELEAA